MLPFIRFLEGRYAELSDPSYMKYVTPSSEKIRQEKGISLKVVTATDSAPSQTGYKAEGSGDCFIHSSSKHSITDCNVFKKKTFEEKRDLIMEHKRCLLCLGPHFKRTCTVTPKCNICQGAHLTLMHRDKSTNNFQRSISSAVSQETPANNSWTPHGQKLSEGVSSLCTTVCGGDAAKSCSKVVLVDLSLPSRSSKVLRCYAIWTNKVPILSSLLRWQHSLDLSFLSVTTTLEHLSLSTLQLVEERYPVSESGVYVSLR